MFANVSIDDTVVSHVANHLALDLVLFLDEEFNSVMVAIFPKYGKEPLHVTEYESLFAYSDALHHYANPDHVLPASLLEYYWTEAFN